MTTASEFRALFTDYKPCFGEGWRYASRRCSYFRRQGMWLHAVEMYISRYGDAYVPTNKLHFLLGADWTHPCEWARLSTEHPNVNRWIRRIEHVGKVENVFSQMVTQFRPPLMAPLEPTGIGGVLDTAVPTWTVAYAKTVLAAERCDEVAAKLHYDECMCRLGSQEFDWQIEASHTLKGYIEMMDRPDQLRATLAEVEERNWAAFLKWAGLKK